MRAAQPAPTPRRAIVPGRSRPARLRAGLAAALLLLGAARAPAQAIDGDQYYRLTTMWRGDSLALDVVRDGPRAGRPLLARGPAGAGQQWQLVPVGFDRYRLVNRARGVDQSLDLAPAGPDELTVAPTRAADGPLWEVTPRADGYVNLTTTIAGRTWALDIRNDGVNTTPVPAPPGDYSGQYWRLTPVGAIPGLGRSLVDRPDDITGAQIKLVYVIPQDGVDDGYDYRGQIATQVALAQRWVKEQVNRRLRFDTFGGALDITFVRMSLTAAGFKQAIQGTNATVSKQVPVFGQLLASGLTTPGKLYVLFYGGSNFNGDCQSFGGGQVTTLVLKEGPPDAAQTALTPCGYMPLQVADGPFRQANEVATVASTLVHEVFHSVGMVPACALNSHPTTHLTPISSDIMAFDGTGYSTYTLDTPRNQYYGHDRKDCPDLAKSGIWDDTPPETPLTPRR